MRDARAKVSQIRDFIAEFLRKAQIYDFKAVKFSRKNRI